MNSTNETLLFDRFLIMYNLCVFTCIIVMFVFHCTHVRMSYVLNSYLLTYLTISIVTCPSPVVNTAPLFCLNSPWYQLSIFASALPRLLLPTSLCSSILVHRVYINTLCLKKRGVKFLQ